ncbi:30S ribosomal protein S4 [Candidatus Roizmanbacteria bacterium CG02_land_8_20_14_3_00_36_15]|uniref:Small ribosomal subunit protein uS4 n=2 Tax=Candidatus Roizmaniibacteriota TaxID=1752723 RepID=A0A2M8KLW9_9BACT|nr:MAG: 30S ribosomal protein S4 [Candidatus Roizmanbacteria bacterium CG03_land_8_20_14_0_80_36_21]PIV37872.1 MAG: 30S ribosomal protein S4 [Candidatus Roizmanbacteria bacterium CG02_land_8_20_14_3_00_36_15]PIY70169.1 MAG: 30S ribosomal protein S4 [Candidatus Roizmanbacteria bacterium CG_4_10_14_0_8_um_filter_36_36]PJA53647.1 MAG: 30S ribosomal protein S4 [Candidatus Roizmanbacteria bacterium CG_4_9_14_3_um_filter_36_11]PJC81680.1 MAG: 30S ribosomal protein S4 [Candidatus Roizmanbacteria bacte
MRYTGPRNRIARREGIDLGLKTVGTKAHGRLLRKINISPGQHGTKRKRKSSEWAVQLREKQKLRYLFGLTEKQLKKYFKTAKEKPGNTKFYLAQSLEKRLDNIVYRLGLAPTRASARQLITHRHIKINDKVVNIPSYQVSVGEKIGFSKEKTMKIPYIEKQLTNKDIFLPIWLKRQAVVGKLMAEPTEEQISKQINLRLVIEYYSR